MTGEPQPAPFERAELTEQDLAIAALVGHYIERESTTKRRACTTCWR